MSARRSSRSRCLRRATGLGFGVDSSAFFAPRLRPVFAAPRLRPECFFFTSFVAIFPLLLPVRGLPHTHAISPLRVAHRGKNPCFAGNFGGEYAARARE